MADFPVDMGMDARDETLLSRRRPFAVPHVSPTSHGAGGLSNTHKVSSGPWQSAYLALSVHEIIIAASRHGLQHHAPLQGGAAGGRVFGNFAR